MSNANTLIAQARAWLGCNEYDGSHKKIIDLYNSHRPLARGYRVKYTDHWCATFVSACAIKVGYTDIIPTECGCGQFVELLKRKGAWIEDESITPKPGYIVLYDWDDNGVGNNTGWPDHIGIVESVNGSTITIIEGNLSNAVKRRTLQVNARYIRGYGAPKYKDNAPVVTPTPDKSIDQVARDVIAGQYGNGTARKNAITSAGYDYNAVQARVNEILAGGKKSVTEIAKEVIAGKWGNGSERKNRLTKAGYNYNAVQAEVNRLL